MRSRRFRLHWIPAVRLIVLALPVALCTLSHAQDPVSPELAPALTDNQEIAPVTTLSPDLLVPQRAYIYDATGSSVFASALNPESTSADYSDSMTQMDTAVRDSSQAGQLNPFAFGGSRLSALAGASGPPNISTSVSSSGRQPLSSGQLSSTGDSSADSSQGGSDAMTNTWQSSWGSSAGPQEGGSSWGATQSASTRWGVPGSSQSFSGDSAGSSYGSENVTAGGAYGASVPSPSSAAMNPSTSRSAPSNALPSGAASADLNARLSSASTTSSLRRTSFSDHNHALRTTNQSLDQASNQGPDQGNRQSPETLERLLLFSPQSYAGYTFGRAPFSAPGEDMTFLRPNIYDTTPVQLSSNRRLDDLERRQQERQSFGLNDDLSASSIGYRARYGARAAYGESKSHMSYGERRKSRPKNPYLQGGQGLEDSGISDLKR